ncbi:MAG: DUF177 domain-containing protein [Ilumatobacter sp.]
MDTKALRPLRVNAVEMLRQPGAVKDIEVTVAGADLDVAHDALAGDIGVEVALETMNDGIVVRGEVHAPWARPCRRCLRDLTGVAVAAVDELYQVEIIDEDAFPIEDNQLDLAPMARQAALLELDDERVCTDDCAGLCPTCGIDLNTGTCDCDNEVKDARWAALDGLVLDD